MHKAVPSHRNASRELGGICSRSRGDCPPTVLRIHNISYVVNYLDKPILKTTNSLLWAHCSARNTTTGCLIYAWVHPAPSSSPPPHPTFTANPPPLPHSTFTAHPPPTSLSRAVKCTHMHTHTLHTHTLTRAHTGCVAVTCH